MALTKVKQAQKKARHQRKRKTVQINFRKANRANRLRQKRMHKLFAEGRREHQRTRRSELDYVKQIEEELSNE